MAEHITEKIEALKCCFKLEKLSTKTNVSDVAGLEQWLADSNIPHDGTCRLGFYRAKIGQGGRWSFGMSAIGATKAAFASQEKR